VLKRQGPVQFGQASSSAREAQGINWPGQGLSKGAGPKRLQAATARSPGWQKVEGAMWFQVLTLAAVTVVLAAEIRWISKA
jgi:hypothetical protein